jgi:hypothetical protein
MTSDLTVVIADVTRKAALASGFRLAGRILQFTNRDLSSALEAIRTHEPRMVAIDTVVAPTQQGQGFIKRIENLAVPGCAIRLIVRTEGVWTTAPLELPSPNAGASSAPIAPSAPSASASPSPLRSAIVAAPQAGANTRRAPRFPILDALGAEVEGGQANLINISVLGAQVVSHPVLRPGQTVKIALPDADEVLRFTASVAWSTFEQTNHGAAVYRAGVAFNDATKEALEEYCRCYGAENPLPSY